MAKNIGSLMDKLQGLGFQASPEVAKAAEEKHEQEAVAANVPVGTIDDHNERFLAFAAAGIQLLGYDKFAQGLDKAVHWSSGDDVYNFLDRLDGAVDKRPLAEGERFRAMMGEVARRKGVPTRSGELSAVQAALPFAEEWVKRQREAERAAGRLEVPEPEEGEDLGTYRNRLDAWAAGQRGDLLKRINFDAWHIVQEEEKKREAVKAAARAKLQAQAEAELKVVLSDREYTHAVSGLSSWAQKYYELYKNDGAYNGPNFDRETVARAVVAASPWPWTLYFFWEVQPYEERGGISLYAPESVPAPADAANLTDRWVLGRVTNHDTQKSGVLLRSEVVRRWPVQSGYVRLIDVGVDRYNTPVRYAVYQDRVVKKVESSNDLPPTGPGTYLTDPNLKGWWNGRWCSPTVWQALERLNHASKGAVFITPELMENYGRHAEKGYPRFYFSVSAGRRYNTFDLPVWRPMQGDGWLVQRLDDIRTLRQHGVSVPESAYWMDVQIGITQKGAPRLEPMRQGQKAIPAILTKRGEGAMSQGKWGWSNQVHSAVEKSEQGGSKIVWSTYVSSSGGGVHRTFDLLLIAQGGSIGMSNGTAITFNGREIVKVAGGALPTQNDPSRGEVPTEIPCQDRGKEDQTYLDPQGKNPSVCEKCGEQYSPYKHVSEVLVPHWTTRHPDSGMIRH